VESERQSDPARPSEGNDEASPEPGLEGRIIAERYRVEKLLGEGGMGAVYRAEHIHMRKTVALKVLHAEMTSVEEVVARFEREAVAAGRIAHPNVAAATDFGQLENGSFFLVLEYAEGQDLRHLLTAGPLPPERCIHITRQVAGALGAAHALTIIHRDLKPDNVMLVDRDDDPDFVKVLDFGIAKVTLGDLKDQPALTRMGAVFGTPDYMSPEQALGQPVDHRSDIYALGVLMFEMLTGQTPFEDDDAMVVLAQQITAPPPPLPEHVPAPLAALVTRMLSKDVEQRPQSAAEVIEVLDSLDPTSHVAVPPSFATRQPSHPGMVATALAVPARTSMESMPGAAAIVPATPAAPSVRQAQPFETMARDAMQSFDKIAPSLRKPVTVGSATFPTWLPLAGVAGLGVLLLLVIVITTVVVVGTRSTSSVASASSGVVPSPSWKPVEPAIDAPTVSAKDVDRIEGIPVYKRDVEDWVTLSRGYAQQKRHRDCALAYRSVLQLERSRRNDPQLLSDLRVAALDPDAYALVVNLAEGRAGLGTTGLELLWDIWGDLVAKGDDVRAASSLQKLVILSRRASKSLRVAIDLNATDRCEKLDGILDRAQKYADTRALARLQYIQGKTGCSKEGCFPCLAGSTKLTKSIERAKSHKAPTLAKGYR
jgi:eukaryotic-like serine/threonine-protein kinase